MKILHVAESAKGGVGTYLSELIPLQIAALGAANIRIVAPDAHMAQIGAPEESLVRYPRRDRSPASLLRLTKAIGRTVAMFRPDVIHVHSTFAGLAVRSLYGWRPGRPRIIYCPHGWAFDMAGPGWRRKAAAAVERAMAGFCDRIVAVSRHEANAGRRIGIAESKIDIVLNGIADLPPAVPAPWEDARLKVLFVGRLDWQKGYDTLLDAIVPLKNRISVRVAGEAVSGRIVPTHGDDGIDHLGWLSRHDIGGQLAAADMLIIPSRWEGFGLVALEAMRAGRMVIASNVGGLREVVRHDVSGWLVTPDAPAALGRLITQSSPAQRKRMGANGRARFLSHFTSARMHAQLMEVYDRAAAGRAPVGRSAAR